MEAKGERAKRIDKRSEKWRERREREGGELRREHLQVKPVAYLLQSCP